MGIHFHTNSLVREQETGTVEPEVLCRVHKLSETWDGKRELVGEINLELLETRGGEVSNNRFHVGARTSECQRKKVRKCDVRCDWHTPELPLHITVENREQEKDHEYLDPPPLSVWNQRAGMERVTRPVETECDHV